MGSRQVLQQQNRGDAAVPAGGAIKQKNMAVERKNRRALGDIGNVVTVRGVEGKPLPQVSRPITRGFCAQLLANAQAAAVENNNKNQAKGAIVVDGALLDKRAVAAARVQPVQRKPAITKPKQPQEIIDISPDTADREKAPILDKEEKASKKKAPTLTSTLTARSKAAANKPKEQIVDIDAGDVNNDLAVVEYVEDMYMFYKSVENESRPHDYMKAQPEINEKMRAILIDWLVQVHHKFELYPETLYLTINIVDRYLAMKTASRRELQLLGMSAMLIASKYEEIWAPEVNDLVCISDGTYNNTQVLVMEKKILGALEWYLTVPTPYVFLVRFIKASLADSDVEKSMVYYLAELGIMNYATIAYCPSMFAAAAVYAARCTLNKTPIWNETLRMHTGYAEVELMDCVKLLLDYHSKVRDQKLQGICRKYSRSEQAAVALLPPASAELATD